ncbi:porin family protein [Photobacterium sanguinicancri]|uniref:porin family protein n=1 Tax=Photobacterium sanguinicancri TaxID=875932 RepID=UPI003D133063
MKKLLALAIVSTIGFGATAAQAEGLYVGGDLQLQQQTAKDSGVKQKTKLGSINGKVGYEVNEYFSVEGRAGMGVKNGKYTAGSTELKAKEKYNVGAYALASYPITDSFSVYGLAGYSYGKVSLEANGDKEKVSLKGLSYGVGAKYKVTEQIALTTEVGHYGKYKKGDMKVSKEAVSLGVQYSF